MGFMRTALTAVLVALAAGGCAITVSPVSTNYFYVGGKYVGEGAQEKLSGHMMMLEKNSSEVAGVIMGRMEGKGL